MPLLDQILGGNIGQLFKDVVGTFKLSPEDKAKFQAAIDENQTQITLKQMDMEKAAAQAVSDETKASLAAYQAEQTQDDGFTKHWRPTFGYMVTLLLFWNYAIVPLLGKPPVTIPDRLFEMFGALLLVAIGGRSFEKIFAPGQGK